MKTKISIAILLTLLCTIPSYAGKVVLDSLESRILSSKVFFNVYLPDGYQKDGQTLPLTFLLHGLHGTHNDWPSHLKPVADQLLANGEMCPMVVVMPNAGGADISTVLNGYFNMPGCSYEDFFFGELIHCVESRYNCGGSKSMRAIMGLSMGGGGSTVYCQRHPDVFSSCYAMSPWLDNDANQVGGKRDKVDCFTLTSESVRVHSAIRFLREAGESTLSELRTVNWFFDCGDDDFLFDQSVMLHQLMRQKHVKDELRVRDGAHNWEYWHTALHTALPFVSRNFKR